jgi:hypothetical protein
VNIVEVEVAAAGVLRIVAEDGRSGTMDVRPYFDSVAFRPLADPEEFAKVRSGGYYVEWACGADLSADTIEARWVRLPSLDEQGRSAARRG